MTTTSKTEINTSLTWTWSSCLFTQEFSESNLKYTEYLHLQHYFWCYRLQSLLSQSSCLYALWNHWKEKEMQTSIRCRHSRWHATDSICFILLENYFSERYEQQLKLYVQFQMVSSTDSPCLQLLDTVPGEVMQQNFFMTSYWDLAPPITQRTICVWFSRKALVRASLYEWSLLSLRAFLHLGKDINVRISKRLVIALIAWSVSWIVPDSTNGTQGTWWIFLSHLTAVISWPYHCYIPLSKWSSALQGSINRWNCVRTRG